MRFGLPAIAIGCALFVGCGTTKYTDTKRTATEQLLITDAMDRAVSRFDFRAVSGKKVFLDDSYVSSVTDAEYLISSLRQQMLAAGCILMESRNEADYVVEVRAGAVGTDRRDLLFGVPATQIPALIPLPTAAASIPEMPLATKTEQRAVAKIACFAYNRHTGRPIWQSGIVPVESEAKNIWVLGAGPFQKGNIYEGTKFAGEELKIPLIADDENDKDQLKHLSVADEAYFEEPKPPLDDIEAEAQLAKKDAPEKKAPTAAPDTLEQNVAEKAKPLDAEAKVVPAGHVEPVEPAKESDKEAAGAPEPPAGASEEPGGPPVESATPPPASSPVEHLPTPLPDPEVTTLGLPLWYDEPSFRDLLPGTSNP